MNMCQAWLCKIIVTSALNLINCANFFYLAGSYGFCNQHLINDFITHRNHKSVCVLILILNIS